jgi:transcription antitermination factor NusG
MVKSVKSVGKQLRLVEQPLHRGYVFVQMAMDRDLHDAVLAPNGSRWVFDTIDIVIY